MSRSFAPIGWPICSRPALITPYTASTGASRARTSIAPNTASSCEVSRSWRPRSAIRPPRRCLYKHLLRRLPKCDQKSFRADASRGPIRYWYRAEIASSKIDRLCRRIFDRRKILIERLERCKNCQKRSGRRRLDNESLPFFSDNCVPSRQLEFARNSHRLIPPILEKFDVSLSHPFYMACGVKRGTGVWPDWGRFRSPTYRRSLRCSESQPHAGANQREPFSKRQPPSQLRL
jgi:hypothetical protein